MRTIRPEEIGQRFYRLRLPAKRYKKILPLFSFSAPGARFMPRFRQGAWDGVIRLITDTGKVSKGLLRAQEGELKKLGYQVKFPESVSYPPVLFYKSRKKSDRKYQNDCVKKMIQVSKLGGGLVLNATGSGKTLTTGLYFHRLQGAACFVVDELTLLHQARKELSKVLGKKVGIVGEQKFKPGRITVATIQTLHRHRGTKAFKSWTAGLQAIVIDEVHLAMNRRNFETVSAINPPVVFGLTATLSLKRKPIRLKAWALAGPVIFEYPLERGVREGYLAKGIVCQVLYENVVDEDDQGSYFDDYKDLIVNDKDRNRVIKTLVTEAHNRGKYIIVLVERLRHLKKLKVLLKKFPLRVVSGQKEVGQRIEAKKRFELGKIRLILANKVFKKGVDIQRVDAIIDAAAMKSKNDSVQKFGRGIRLHKEKSGLLYFDISDKGNRFQKAARSRKRGLKERGIPIESFVWEKSKVSKLFDKLEKLLEA